MNDWREDYIVCEHVELSNQVNRHQQFRVCCEVCYQFGFFKANLKTWVIGKQVYGRMPKAKKARA